MGRPRRRRGVVTPRTPKRGDLVWLNFSPQAGHEQSGHRPALVISQDAFNERRGLIIACPVTSRIKGYAFEIRVNIGDVSGVVLADQPRSLDWRARGARFIASSAETVALAHRVAEIVATIVGVEAR